MKKSTLVAAAVLSWSAVFASTVAQAREPDVQWSVTIGSPVFGPPAPQYTPPYPAVTRPAPVYWPPLPVYAPARLLAAGALGPRRRRHAQPP